MFTKVKIWLWTQIVEWLNGIPKRNQQQQAINNTDHLLRDVRPADVILFEGRSRVGEVIKIITLSPWTHAALYIGRLIDIKDDAQKNKIREFYDGDETTPLIIESLLGYGTIINPITNYPDDNLRICRPHELNYTDQNKVIYFAIEHLGLLYDVRQLLDLARFMFPYAILPRSWRSSLFQHNAGRPTHIICSGMIARCFQSVNYPILPTIKADNNDQVRFYKRNFRHFVPADFDYSPYFKIIKFPVWGDKWHSQHTRYQSLPWQDSDKKTTTSSQIDKNKTPRFSTWLAEISTIKAPSIKDIIKINKSPNRSEPISDINADSLSARSK